MRPRSATPPAAGPAPLVAVGLLVVVALAFRVRGLFLLRELDELGGTVGGEAPLVSALWSTSAVGFLLVGTLVTSKRPGNPVGWVLLALPTLFWLPLTEAIEVSSARGEPIPAWALEGSWLLHGVGTPGLLLAALFLLLAFPNAEFTRLGRRLLRGAVPALGILVVVRLVAPGPMDGAGLPNPHAIPALGDAGELLQVLGELLAFLVLPAAWDLVRRYRASRGAERQQFRWVVRSFVAAPVSFLVIVPLGEALLSEDLSQYSDLLGIWVAMSSIAAGFGVSILRFRLWDIDRVVSRTVSYAVVMLLLLGVYLSSVLGIQAVSRPLAGDSDVAVALSTLLAAALFHPLRRRVQRLVDRRFNRSRYDGGRLVEAFGRSLRDELHPQAIAAALCEASGAVLHPRSVSVQRFTPGTTT